MGQKYPVSAECHVTKREFTDKSQTLYELLKGFSQKVAACSDEAIGDLRHLQGFMVSFSSLFSRSRQERVAVSRKMSKKPAAHNLTHGAQGWRWSRPKAEIKEKECWS